MAVKQQKHALTATLYQLDVRLILFLPTLALGLPYGCPIDALVKQKQLCYIYNAQRNAEAKKTNRIRCAFSFAQKYIFSKNIPLKNGQRLHICLLKVYSRSLSAGGTCLATTVVERRRLCQATLPKALIVGGGILWSGPFLVPSSTAVGRTQSGGLWPCADRNGCGMSSKIDPLFRLKLTHPNVFRVWVSFFIISDFYTVI